MNFTFLRIFACTSLLFSPFAISKELLIDPHFKQGISVYAPSRHPYTDGYQNEGNLLLNSYLNQKQNPKWHIAQWGTHHSLIDATPVTLANGGTRWAVTKHDNNKPWVFQSLTLEPGSSPTVTLELNGLAHYAYNKELSRFQPPRYISSLEEKWPHLLLSQPISSGRLNQYTSLLFSMDAKLLFDRKNQNNEYAAERHAGRFVVSFIISNTFSKNYFWLILPIYDDRMEVSPYGCKHCDDKNHCKTIYKLKTKGRWSCPFDGGLWKKDAEKKSSFKMIFRVGSKEFMEGSLSSLQWQSINIDLIPVIREAIQAARQQEKAQGFSPSLKNYKLQSLIAGWEINGFNHASMQIRNISLQGTP